jgi:hemolysin activation/secretion protein
MAFPLRAFALVSVLFFSLPGPNISAAPPSPKTSQADDKILITDIKITGNRVISSEELSLWTCCYINERVDLAELEGLADLLTEYYRFKGYTLARAYIPEQDVRNGVVEIAILEGAVSDIRVIGNELYTKRFIREGFGDVLADRALKYSSLERSLVLLNETTDLKVGATLEPGLDTGSTSIVVKVDDKPANLASRLLGRPVHAALSYDNYGSNFISRNRFGATTEIANLLREGSLLTMNGIIGQDPDKLLFETIAYSIPIDRRGTRFVFTGSNGRFDVGGALAALGIQGRIKTYDVSISHPFIKTRFESLWVEVGYASKDYNLDILARRFASDHFRMLKGGINYLESDRLGRSFVSLYGFQGLGDFLGGMNNGDPQASRRGADNRFTMMTLNASRVQSITEQTVLILQGFGQIATSPLGVIQQYNMGGPGSVRGYQLGEQNLDEAYTVSAEYQFPTLVYKPANFAVFFDYGAGRVRTPNPGESRSYSMTGTGFGIRSPLPFYQSSLNFDLGFPVGAKPQGGTLGGGHSPTAYIQVIARF